MLKEICFLSFLILCLSARVLHIEIISVGGLKPDKYLCFQVDGPIIRGIISRGALKTGILQYCTLSAITVQGVDAVYKIGNIFSFCLVVLPYWFVHALTLYKY